METLTRLLAALNHSPVFKPQGSNPSLQGKIPRGFVGFLYQQNLSHNTTQTEPAYLVIVNKPFYTSSVFLIPVKGPAILHNLQQ